MRRLQFVVIAVMAVAGAFVALAPQALAGGQQTLKGSDTGAFHIPGSCTDGGLQVVIGGTGTATHIGRYTYTAVECFNASTGLFEGEATFISPNGDTLFGTYRGRVSETDDPLVIIYEEELSITGGTGRFADVTGQLFVTGLANLGTGDYSQELSGTITRSN
jgi:hypothetical protein